MKHGDLMQYFVALNLSSEDWCLYFKYTKHLNNRNNYSVYNKVEALISYQKAREAMFKNLIQEYDLCISRDLDRINETYSDSVKLKVPLGMLGFIVKAENQVLYYIIRSMIIFFQYEFSHEEYFTESLGKYFEMNIINELYQNIMSEIERFCVLVSKSPSGIFNLQTSEIMFTTFMEEKCDFEVKRLVPNLISLFYTLDYEHTMDIWNFINIHLYRDQEGLWEYYYLLTYHRNDLNLNIEFNKKHNNKCSLEFNY
jgi:hypothetical protein